MRISGADGKSKPLFAAYHPAKHLVLRCVISHSAPHHPLPRAPPPMETITHPTLVQLVAAGAVRVVVAVGQPSGWTILVRYGLAERALAAQRSRQIRVFRKLDTLQSYLQEVGVNRFEVDASGFVFVSQ